MKTTINSLKEQLANAKALISPLKESEQQYRHFFEKSPTMIYALDQQGIFVNINRAGAKMLGFKHAATVIGKHFKKFFLVNRNDLRRYRDQLERTGVIEEMDTRMKRTDGTLRDVQLSAAIRETITGKVRGYEGFVIDITAKKEAEKHLVESELKYKFVLDNSLAAIYMFQDGGTFSYVNPRMVNLLGYSCADEILGKRFWEIIAPVDREMVKARGLEREQREIHPKRYEFRMITKTGETIWVDMRASHASYLGRPAAVGNFIDITREKKAEKQVRQLTRQLIDGIEEERRALASDIHDEFGQMLTMLQFEVESLQNGLAFNSTASMAICQKVTRQIQRLAEAVRDTTSRLRPDMLDHLGLVPTLQWYIDDINNRRPETRIVFQSNGLKKRIPPEVELVLYRVFQEGLTNITKHAKASHVNLQLTYNHPYIIFIIKDDGGGFVPSDSGIPFQNQRVGVGLLSMKERVSSLDGSLVIHSTPGKGTVLRIRIPIGERKSNEIH